MRNNCGPRTEPCGTTREIDKCLEVYPLTETFFSILQIRLKPTIGYTSNTIMFQFTQ